MADEFDEDEIDHGVELIREPVDYALEIMERDKEGALNLLRVQFREQVANALTSLILKDFPDKWPSPLLIALSVPETRADYHNNTPLVRAGYELMDLYDAAIVNKEKWLQFFSKLDEFEKILLDSAKRE